MFGPTLGGQRHLALKLWLKPTKERHLNRCRMWLNDPTVNRYLSVSEPITRVSELQWWLRNLTDEQTRVWSIHWGREHVGQTSIESIDLDRRTGVTGVVIGAKQYWGKGLAKAVIQVRSEYAFRPIDEGGLGLVALYTKVYAPNIASRKALESCGYRQFGIEPMAKRIGSGYEPDDYIDGWLGVLTRQAWLDRQVG